MFLPSKIKAGLTIDWYIFLKLRAVYISHSVITAMASQPSEASYGSSIYDIVPLMPFRSILALFKARGSVITNSAFSSINFFAINMAGLSLVSPVFALKANPNRQIFFPAKVLNIALSILHLHLRIYFQPGYPSQLP